MDIGEKLGYASKLARQGWDKMTVAELTGKLAGLPPMMEIFIDADGTSMFVNDVVIEQLPAPEDGPVKGVRPVPYARIKGSVTPEVKQAPEFTHEEAVAIQRNKAQQLAYNMERARETPAPVM